MISSSYKDVFGRMRINDFKHLAQRETIAFMSEFELDDVVKATLIEHLQMGRDPRESYELLWPSDPPAPYSVFLRCYSQLVVAYLKTAGSRTKPALDEDDTEAVEQRRDIRRGLHDAFNEALGMVELTEDQSRRYQALCKLASAHAQQCKRKREDEKFDIEAASSMHNLMASNAERDRD